MGGASALPLMSPWLLFCGIVYALRADVRGCSDMHFHIKLKRLSKLVLHSARDRGDESSLNSHPL